MMNERVVAPDDAGVHCHMTTFVEPAPKSMDFRWISFPSTSKAMGNVSALTLPKLKNEVVN